MGFFKRKTQETQQAPPPTFEDANRRIGEIANRLQFIADQQTELFIARTQGRVSDMEVNGQMELLTMEEQRLTEEQVDLLSKIEKLPRNIGRSAIGSE